MPVDGSQGKSNFTLLPTGVNPNLAPAVRPNKIELNKADDAFSISDKSHEFARVRKLVDSQPDFRLAKVNSLSKAIEEGHYNKNGEMIADALIRRNLVDLRV